MSQRAIAEPFGNHRRGGWVLRRSDSGRIPECPICHPLPQFRFRGGVQPWACGGRHGVCRIPEQRCLCDGGLASASARNPRARRGNCGLPTETPVGKERRLFRLCRRGGGGDLTVRVPVLPRGGFWPDRTRRGAI